MPFFRCRKGEKTTSELFFKRMENDKRQGFFKERKRKSSFFRVYSFGKEGKMPKREMIFKKNVKMLA